MELAADLVAVDETIGSMVESVLMLMELVAELVVELLLMELAAMTKLMVVNTVAGSVVVITDLMVVRTSTNSMADLLQPIM